MHERTTLPTDVGVELAHALTADVADRSACRVLFIKGPVAVAQQLRPQRASTDVDVWVDPAQHETLLRALAEHGWKNRFLPDGPRILESHSVTLLHDNWPCDIDVHRYFPGLLADPEPVFELLWQRRETVEIAGRSVPACDRTASSLVLAAHQLRDFDVPRNQVEYQWLIDRFGDDLDAAGRADLRELAVATRTMDSLRTFLVDLGIQPPAPPIDNAYSERLHDWRMRSSNNTPTSRWLYTIRRTPWQQRPSVMWRALVLPGDLLDQLHPEVGSRGRDRTRARLARIGRGLRAVLPSLAADIRAGRPPSEKS